MKCQYYKEFQNKRICIAAPFPKPYGGVSVHAYRLKGELELKGNMVCVYQAHLYSNPVQKCYAILAMIIAHKPEILISHTSYNGFLESLLFIFLRLFWFNSWVLVDHDCRYLDSRSRLFKAVHAQACVVADQVVLMGNMVRDLYERHGMFHETHCTDSPYISPALTESSKKDLSPEIQDFLSLHSLVLLMNGSCFMKDSLGRDLYGFDQAIQLVNELKCIYPKIGLIILLAKNNDQSYFNKLNEKIDDLDLKTSIKWLIGDYYLPTIVPHVTLMIRPTTAENFGISIAEAIDLGIPVVASDCCDRYPGALIYQANENKDFLQSVRSVLDRKDSSSHYVR
jgi:glycosyltransferase involved in cell wall biosynthesis